MTEELVPSVILNKYIQQHDQIHIPVASGIESEHVSST